MKSSILDVARVLVALATLSALGVACLPEDPGPANAGPAPTCDGYCREVMKQCSGANEQYRSMAECMNVCGLLNLGTADDGETNTVACRFRIARNATTLDECVKAGAYGGGTCGKRCTSFCQIAAKNCATAAAPPYRSAADCDEVCNGYKVSTEGEGPRQVFDGKDSFNCRSHHLILSLGDRDGHCPHAGKISATCVQPL